jgi:hypothetical protein
MECDFAERLSHIARGTNDDFEEEQRQRKIV